MSKYFCTRGEKIFDEKDNADDPDSEGKDRQMAEEQKTSYRRRKLLQIGKNLHICPDRLYSSQKHFLKHMGIVNCQLYVKCTIIFSNTKLSRNIFTKIIPMKLENGIKKQDQFAHLQNHCELLHQNDSEGKAKEEINCDSRRVWDFIKKAAIDQTRPHV